MGSEVPAREAGPGLDHRHTAWRRYLQRFSERHGLALRKENEAGLLLGGAAILDATYALIRGAQRSLRFEMYIWKPDAVGVEIADQLAAAAKRGVQVRGVVDDLGCLGAGSLIAKVQAAGGIVRRYHPVAPWRPLHIWNRRNHRKVVIADGAEAVVGSANWAEEYDLRLRPGAYLDLGVAVRGPSVADLGEDFRRVWRRCTRGELEAAATLATAPLWRGEWFPGATIQIVTSLRRFGARAIGRHVELLVRQAKGRLWIANAYFIPSLRLRRLLARASRRGVDLHLLLPGLSDNVLTQAASRAVYGPLLRAGAKISEREGRFLHAKAALLGQDLALIGTANLDSRSFRHNLELNLLIQHEGLATRLEEAFVAQLTQSREVSLEDWEARSWLTRVWQSFAYGLRYWL